MQKNVNMDLRVNLKFSLKKEGFLKIMSKYRYNHNLNNLKDL
ncbi:unnamed protein product [marine sediment metagenome]|uniref:Uncharacterized protein n=1 Tax=marine sediment metagenome TaxID=412755 RepID=X0ZUT6_9ZZZZ